MGVPGTQHLKFLTLLLFSFTLYSLAFLDQELANYFAGPEREAFRFWCRRLTDIGEGAPYFLLFALLWGFSKWAPDRVNILLKNSEASARLLEFGRVGFRTLVIVGLAIHVFKFLLGRQRPHLTESFQSFIFEPMTFHWHWHSMPSGHSQVSFVVATLFASILPRWKFLIYGLAMAVAFTRVPIQQHFLSDVIVGGFIGHIGAIFSIRWHLQVSPRGGLTPHIKRVE